MTPSDIVAPDQSYSVAEAGVELERSERQAPYQRCCRWRSRMGDRQEDSPQKLGGLIHPSLQLSLTLKHDLSVIASSPSRGSPAPREHPV